MPTISAAIHSAQTILSSAGIDTPRLDAQLIMAWVCKLRREDIARQPERELTSREDTIFRKAIELRAQRRPLPYITGEAWFYGRRFKVNRAVLIPRPETELLVEFAKGVVGEGRRSPVRIADIGTGSGCIAVTVAAELPDSTVVATDISRLALLVAAKNICRHDIGGQIELREGDLCEPLAQDRFDVILSNPPYIDITEAPSLMPEVADYEPAIALYGLPSHSAGDTSPRSIRRQLMSEARRSLAQGGWLAIELGADQDGEARADAADFGYTVINILKDDAGIGRVVVGKYNC